MTTTVAAGAGQLLGPGAGATSPFTALANMSTLDQVACCGLLRVSQAELQNVRESLIRQVGNIMAKKPASWDIVAWFIDIESGRMELDQRGGGTAHLRYELPVERAGGLDDLLAESQRKNCRFAAVIVENSERVARVTYFGTKIEYELGKRNIEIFAADEGIDTAGKKATKILMRRMKQAIGEYHAINVMEQAWEGTRVHIREGFNTGPIPYGYLAHKLPHPAPAKKSRGLTRTRLVTDPERGSVITTMFTLRVVDKMTYGQIARMFAADPIAYPLPKGGAWTLNTVRSMLHNPKYTGHMVWNRSTTRTGATVNRKRTTRPNPVDQWVWSDEPTHEALVSLDMFRAAQTVGSETEGSRADTDANTHPATVRTYVLRGLIRCGFCGRRLHGTVNDGHTYYKCTGPRDKNGKPTMAGHPGSLYIREDALLPAVIDAVAERVFGPNRIAHLTAQHDAQPRQQAAEHAREIEAAADHLTTLTGRQDSLMAELEELDPADPMTKTWRERIRARFTALETERQDAHARHAGLVATQPAIIEHLPELLEGLPTGLLHLDNIPHDMLRLLLDALHVTIRLDSRTDAHLSMTLTTGTATAVNGVITVTDDDPATVAQFRKDAMQNKLLAGTNDSGHLFHDRVSC